MWPEVFARGYGVSKLWLVHPGRAAGCPSQNDATGLPDCGTGPWHLHGRGVRYGWELLSFTGRAEPEHARLPGGAAGQVVRVAGVDRHESGP